MQVLNLGIAVALTAAAAQAAVQPLTTPFLPGENAVAVVDCEGGLGSFTAIVQGSYDNVNWTNLVTITAQGPVSLTPVTVQPYMRLDVSTVGTGGTVSAYLIAGP